MTLAATITESRDVQLLKRCALAARRIRTQVARVIVGQDEVVDALLITLLARGHALLVGVPGLAKTLLVGTVARSLSLSFGRVQFTPDLLPADITGTDVLNEVDAGGATCGVRFASCTVPSSGTWFWRTRSTARPPRHRRLCCRQCRNAT